MNIAQPASRGGVGEDVAILGVELIARGPRVPGVVEEMRVGVERDGRRSVAELPRDE